MTDYSHSSAKSEAGDVAAWGAEDPRPSVYERLLHVHLPKRRRPCGVDRCMELRLKGLVEGSDPSGRQLEHPNPRRSPWPGPTAATSAPR
jgi:hypothetical protein